MSKPKPRHRARWTLTRRVEDYEHLNFETPHEGEGRHRDSDDD